MKVNKIKINTKTKKYSIVIGRGLINKVDEIINNNNLFFEKCLIVNDSNIPNNFKKLLNKKLKSKKIFKIDLIASEKNKNYKTIEKIHKILFERRFNRSDSVISFGGGIIGDIVGFASSTFKRGLKFINIPTTLLSQVDSSIGGKTGINTNQGKNLIGSFYQPILVISDTNFLKSLSKREVICGYGEILRHAIISNKVFYNFLNKNFFNIIKLKSPFIDKAIYESCKIKKIVVEKDEKENGMRKILNFGHTFAHAYEASLGFSKKLNHGEAVILGMNTALSFS